MKRNVWFTVILGVLLSLLVYQARRASQFQHLVAALQTQQEQLTSDLENLRREAAHSKPLVESKQRAAAEAQRQAVELNKLRNEVTRLRMASTQHDQTAPAGLDMTDPFISSVLTLVEKASEIRAHLERMPDKGIPELNWLTENDWLAAAKTADLS